VKVLNSRKKLRSLLTFAFYDLSICEEKFGRKLQLLKVTEDTRLQKTPSKDDLLMHQLLGAKNNTFIKGP
jgi:hypothetical protein